MRHCLKEHFPAMLDRYNVWSNTELPYGTIYYSNDYYNIGKDIKTIDWCRTSRLSGEETMLWILRFGETLPTIRKELPLLHNITLKD